MAAPRRLSSALARRWASAHSWAPVDLAAQVSWPADLTVKASASRFFMYEEHRATKLEDDSENIGGSTRLLEQSAAEFFAAVSEDTDEFRYWTSPLASAAPELLARLPDFERLHDDAEAGRGLPTDPRGPSLWVGSANSATQAHYDVADNVLVALHGTKRLRCWPPSAATELHVFPDAHPRARKSQVNFDQPDHARFPLFAELPPPSLDVTLEPGEALLLPAFWFHHVENDPLRFAPGCPRSAAWLLRAIPSMSACCCLSAAHRCR